MAKNNIKQCRVLEKRDKEEGERKDKKDKNPRFGQKIQMCNYTRESSVMEEIKKEEKEKIKEDKQRQPPKPALCHIKTRKHNSDINRS